MRMRHIASRAAAALTVVLLAAPGALAATPATATGPDPVPATAQLPVALPKGKVVSRVALNIRERATSDSRSLGLLQPGAIVTLSCKVTGQNVDGNTVWYRLADAPHGYVAARYVQNLSYVRPCAH
ncbi:MULTISPECIES: SH3 domain-containing protein [unclassified Streptomyces]|uniref:SH3 domain-containing protein n=1 Tax=unclassified Streptomyces TaxID=2593676 RepID=UPI003807254E